MHAATGMAATSVRALSRSIPVIARGRGFASSLVLRARDGGAAAVGLLDGTLTAETFHWPVTTGIPVAIMSTGTNLTIFYKAFDQLPETPADTPVWNDVLGVLYSMGAVSLAMGTEDDEYDRYRAWLYDFIQNGVADSLRGMAINARAK